jgi:hypothetical protein
LLAAATTGAINKVTINMAIANKPRIPSVKRFERFCAGLADMVRMSMRGFVLLDEYGRRWDN